MSNVVNENQETEKNRRGRPKKESPRPSVNEEKSNMLQMETKASETPKISMQDVRSNLISLYNSMLGIGDNINAHAWWTGNIFNFNQYNPFLQNQRLKMINSYPNDMNLEALTDALNNPAGSELALRSQGWSLSSSQFLYYKILRLAADIPMYKYYKTPELLDKKVYSDSKFTNEDEYVDEWLKHFDVVNTLKRMSLEVKREGKPTYLLRNSFSTLPSGKKQVDYCTFQKLPSNYVKLTGIGEHGYIASFNMMLFMNPAFSLAQYPPIIREIWEALVACGAIYENTNKKNKDKYSVDVEKLRNFSYSYSNNGIVEDLQGVLTTEKPEGSKAVSYMYWVQLPQDICFTFCSDASNAWAIPDTAGLFLGLRELTDYDTLAGLIQSTPLTALLTAEAETVNDPNPGQNQTVLSPETIAGFQDKFNNSTSTNLESFFAPLKNFKLLSLPNIPNSSDITSNATKNFLSRAGLSGLIPVTDKPSVAQIKGSQLIEEAACDFVTRQFESVLNFIINNLIGCNYKWNFKLWGNIFSYSNELSDTKEMFVAGATFVLPKLASAYGLSIRDLKGAQEYINSLNIYDDFKTVTQAQQLLLKQNNNSVVADAGTQRVGRPEVKIENIENDNTAASKEGGLDTAETRDFSTFNGKCLICGADSDEPLCEECKERYIEEA